MKTPLPRNIHRRKRLYRIVQSKCTKNIFLSVHKKHMRGFILHSMSLPVSKQQPHPRQVLHTTEKFQRASFQISVRQFQTTIPALSNSIMRGFLSASATATSVLPLSNRITECAPPETLLPSTICHSHHTPLPLLPP